MQSTDIVIYKTGEIELNVTLKENDIWLGANDIASIFDVNRPAIVKHIGNIYKTDELDKASTCSILEQVANDGKKRRMNFYNLDMIISVGYRVNSKKATKFRKWATSILKQYITDGYVINSDKITNDRFVSLEEKVHYLSEKVDILESKNIKPKQGIFYDGQIFDAYTFVSDLIRSAKDKIILIDNYVDDSVLTLFSKNQNIEVIIYTKSITKQLNLDLKKYNSQYKKIEIKKFDNSHDRFLILDEKELYHLGASLKDLGKKWFAFSKMDIKSFDVLKRLESI
ncbi:RhuM family protein [Halarcobacter sp.]|uniref:virulence RhuM family protein n=1 Tax=Halarcobacter sp. TaxID=2321133 RepID=UPI0029F4F6E3|nr:RhuM family protein [Halarcobacter sp.]